MEWKRLFYAPGVIKIASWNSSNVPINIYRWHSVQKCVKSTEKSSSVRQAQSSQNIGLFVLTRFFKWISLNAGGDCESWSGKHYECFALLLRYRDATTCFVTKCYDSTADWTTRVAPPAEAKNFSSNLCVQTSLLSSVYRGSFPGDDGHPRPNADRSPDLAPRSSMSICISSPPWRLYGVAEYLYFTLLRLPS
jgi:hypothetical protein